MDTIYSILIARTFNEMQNAGTMQKQVLNERHLSWWRHQMEIFSELLALCGGIQRSPVNSLHKGQWRGALMSSLICAWINSWVNNREAGDLGRHYDVTVMIISNNTLPTPSTFINTLKPNQNDKRKRRFQMPWKWMIEFESNFIKMCS